MNIQEIVTQLQIDRNIFESIWQQLGLTEAEANRRVNIIDHNIESMSKLVEVIGDTDRLGELTVIVPEK
jgi:hypothetical protein